MTCTCSYVTIRMPCASKGGLFQAMVKSRDSSEEEVKGKMWSCDYLKQ